MMNGTKPAPKLAVRQPAQAPAPKRTPLYLAPTEPRTPLRVPLPFIEWSAVPMRHERASIVSAHVELFGHPFSVSGVTHAHDTARGTMKELYLMARTLESELLKALGDRMMGRTA